jgi:hypothetical protein
VKKIVLASLLGTAVMFAQAPATSKPPAPASQTQTPKTSTNASATTTKKHHKKSKKIVAPANNAVATPAPAK